MNNISETKITSKGIQKILNKYTPERSIAEYVWNGFDANANYVVLEFSENELETIDCIRILDDGIGIDYSKLSEKFQNFLESAKGKISTDGHRLKGKNGYGRLTFYKLATNAQWNTCFNDGGVKYEYSIDIASEKLTEFKQTTPKQTTKQHGTEVVLSNILIGKSKEDFINSVKKYIISDFSWFLALNPSKKIYIDNEELDTSEYIREHEVWDIKTDNYSFKADYFCWNGKLNEEFSKFYFLDSHSNLTYEETTKLNKKGDNFWHTVIVKHSMYDDIFLDELESQSLFTDEEKKKNQRQLEEALNEKLKEKRKPFLKDKAKEFVEKCQDNKTFPYFGNNIWDNERKEQLKALVTEFYEVEPQIFITLTQNQQKVLLALLNLIIDKDAKDDLFKILESIVEIDDENRKKFAKILERTKLKHIIELSELIKNRLDTIDNLKELVFNHDLKATERLHLQDFIEKHYWIFGEEYRLVCAEEAKFEKALRKYRYMLFGIDEQTYIDNQDKYKEMDLFLTGTEYKNDYPQNLVVEIKNPTTIKQLTDKEYFQIKRYINVLLNTDEFNSLSSEWTFMLIGQDYDKILGMEIKDKHSGLVLKGENYKLYIKKWSDIVNDAEARMHYLAEKLNLQKEQLLRDKTLNGIMYEVDNNSAIMPAEVVLPSET